MKRSAALHHLAYLASLGLGDRLVIPLMLDTLATLIPGKFLNFVWLDEREQPCDIWLPEFMPRPLEFYFEADEVLDPGKELTIASALAQGDDIGPGERWNQKPGFHDTILYNETLRPYGIGAGLDLVLRRGGRACGMLFVNREPRLSIFTGEERRLLLTVRPYFLRALEAPAHAPPERDAIDAGRGIVVVRRGGPVVFASHHAPWLLYQQARDERFSRIEQDAAWRETVDLLFARLDAGLVARAERRTGWGTLVFNLHAQGAALPRRFDRDLFVVTIERLVPREIGILRALGPADLSPRERQVAFTLATVASAETGRDRLGMTQATWRDYRKRVYEKLEVHSRSELTARLSAGWDAPAAGG